MDENTIIEELEELIKTFGVQIRNEAIKQEEDLVNIVGGLCQQPGMLFYVSTLPETRILRPYGHITY